MMKVPTPTSGGATSRGESRRAGTAAVLQLPRQVREFAGRPCREGLHRSFAGCSGVLACLDVSNKHEPISREDVSVPCLPRSSYPKTGAYPSLSAPPDASSSSSTLKKELTLFGVYALATGTTLSAGFFLLPGLAASKAGSAVVLAYALAGLALVPAMLSAVELATAMPRSGGAYYFLDRSLGPLAGTIGGLGTWLALVLKTAFALVGMGVYIDVLVPAKTPEWFHYAVAVGLALAFTALNLRGAKSTGRFQVVLVVGLLILLTGFIVVGLPQVQLDRFDDLLTRPAEDIIGTAGLVFISYVGVTKVASVAEEVRDPERILPRGVFLALSTAFIIYLLGMVVLVGTLGVADLVKTLTPVADAGEVIAHPSGRVGAVVLSFAAIFAFSSVANAGILSASRYPLAMSRDHLLPAGFAKVNERGVPVISILFTVSVIVGLVFLDPMKIAKLASAFQLLMFALLCLAVIVMRESRIAAYDPGYRSPLYPWMQIVGMAVSALFIYYMGYLSILFTAGVVLIGAAWYRRFGAARVVRQGAIYHVFERLGRQRFDGLDSELRGILKEKGLRAGDPFEEIVAMSHVFEAHDGESFESVANRAAGIFSANLSLERDALTSQFLEGTRVGATPVTSGVALPHLRLPGIQLPRLVIVRSTKGVEIEVSEIGGDEVEQRRVAAVFFLVSDRDRPTQHLRVLAELAGRVEQQNFMDRWLAAQDEQRLRELLLREDQYLVVRLDGREGWIDRPIRTLELPDDLLIVTVIRADDLIPPKGSTVLARGDRLTMIGSEESVAVLRRQFGLG